MMPTAGGATSGNWLIGRLLIESKPASMITRAITQAKIGRSIKNRDISGAASLVTGETEFSLQLNVAARNRIDLHTRSYPVQAFSNHLLASFDTVAHQPGIANGA